MHVLSHSLAGFFFLWAWLFASAHSSPSPSADPVIASARELLAAASDLPPEERLKVMRPAVATLLLAQFSRLLPPSTTQADLDFWAELLLSADSTTLAQAASRLPPADEVLFDGTQLIGGGFSRADNLVGIHGRPIAMDRQIPISLIPLDPASALRVKQEAALSAADPSAQLALERTEALLQTPLGPAFASDGIFLRPYNGRMDDLYYRLVQEGGGIPGQMTFHAVAEALPNRRYHPLTGVVAPAQAPPPWFSLSDIFSGGGLAAVESYKARQPRAPAGNPFAGLAARLLPHLTAEERRLQPGQKWKIPRSAIQRSLQEPRRFTPAPVEPMFHDPSRFFGWRDEILGWSQISRRLTRSELADAIRMIDLESPLPEIPSEPDASVVLVDPALWTEENLFKDVPDLVDLDNQEFFRTEDVVETTVTPSPEEAETSISSRGPVGPNVLRPRPPSSNLSSNPSPTPLIAQASPTPPPALPPSVPLIAALPLVRKIESPPQPPSTPSSLSSSLLAAASSPTPSPLPSLPESISSPISAPISSPTPSSEASPILLVQNTTPPPAPPELPTPIIPLETPSPTPSPILLAQQSATPVPPEPPPPARTPVPLPPPEDSPPNRPAPILVASETPSQELPPTASKPLLFAPPLTTEELLSLRPDTPTAPDAVLFATLNPTSVLPFTDATPPPLTDSLLPQSTPQPLPIEEKLTLLPEVTPPPQPIAIDAILPETTAAVRSAEHPPMPLDLREAFTLPTPAASPLQLTLRESNLPDPALPAPPDSLLAQLAPTPTPTPPTPEPTPEPESTQIPPSLLTLSTPPSPPLPPIPSPTPRVLPTVELPPGRYVAAVAPPIETIENYITQLSANDSALAINAARLARADSYLVWLDQATDPFEQFLAIPGRVVGERRHLIEAAVEKTTDTLEALLDLRAQLLAQREGLLTERETLRQETVEKGLRESLEKLHHLLPDLRNAKIFHREFPTSLLQEMAHTSPHPLPQYSL